MSIVFKINAPVSTDQFIALLINSTLGLRRPIQDHNCIEGMISNSNLIITAWDGESPVGIARSITDFNFACYLSDLAVDTKYQNKGIGKMLLKLTQEQLGPKCTLILIAAPTANTYYEHLGFKNNKRCWMLEPDKHIIS
jgi:ribosomal protein S18 acetylase RimI-like enzyme